MHEAARRIQVADHMLTMTYPLVKDPKLLLAVISNLVQSMEQSMQEALLKEKIPHTNPLIAYKQHIVRQKKIPVETIRAYEEMSATLKEHKESLVAFRRKEQFIICNEGYKLRTLNAATAKQYVNLAKQFHQANT